jgi:hypothetical protein
MARLGVAPHVIERVLNHVSGTIRGAGIYNRYGDVREKRQALETWGRYVEGLIRSAAREGEAAGGVEEKIARWSGT